MNRTIDGGQSSSAARSRVGAWMADHRGPVRLVVGTVWVAGLTWFLFDKGIVLSRDWVFFWLVTGLLVISVGEFDRWARGVFVDWLPFAFILFAYDLVRGLTDRLNWTVHVLPAIKADKAMFGTPIPNVWIQEHFYSNPAHPGWWNYPAFGIYLTHFFATLVIAAVLWKFAYPKFKRWRNMVVALFSAGLVTYILYPAAPPWYASQHGYLSFQVRKVIDDLWHHFGIHAARAAFEHDQDFVNPTAAIPSLHAAYPMLMFLFFWSTGKLWVRLLTGAYVLLMGVTLVYTGEHYVIDILLGWAYAIGTFVAVVYAERWWARRRERRAAGRPAGEPALAGSGANGQVGAGEPEPVTTTWGARE
jgi:membrane-associated phospholipid phosphatase